MNHWDKIKDIISPYSPRASEKISIRSIPTNTSGEWAVALTPASPVIPIASPAAKEDNPQHNPAAKWEYPLNQLYVFS